MPIPNKQFYLKANGNQVCFGTCSDNFGETLAHLTNEQVLYVYNLRLPSDLSDQSVDINIDPNIPDGYDPDGVGTHVLFKHRTPIWFPIVLAVGVVSAMLILITFKKVD